MTTDLRFGMRRAYFNWMMTGLLEDRLDLKPVASVMLGDLIPGCQADIFAVHQDWSVSLAAFLPDDPDLEDAHRAIDRLNATDDAVLRRMSLTLSRDDGVQKIIVSPGANNAAIASECLRCGVSYIATGASISDTGRMRWLS